jgi:hypothetical protein
MNVYIIYTHYTQKTPYNNVRHSQSDQTCLSPQPQIIIQWTVSPCSKVTKIQIRYTLHNKLFWRHSLNMCLPPRTWYQAWPGACWVESRQIHVEARQSMQPFLQDPHWYMHGLWVSLYVDQEVGPPCTCAPSRRAVPLDDARDLDMCAHSSACWHPNPSCLRKSAKHFRTSRKCYPLIEIWHARLRAPTVQNIVFFLAWAHLRIVCTIFIQIYHAFGCS